MKKSLLISAVFCGFFVANVSICPEVIAVSSIEQKVEDPYSLYNIYLSHKLNNAFFEALLQYYHNGTGLDQSKKETYGSAYSDDLSKRSQEEIDKIRKCDESKKLITNSKDCLGFLACQRFIDNRGGLVRKEVSDGKEYYELDFSLKNIENLVKSKGRSDTINDVNAYTNKNLVDEVLEISDGRFVDEINNIEKCIEVIEKFKGLTPNSKKVLEEANKFQKPLKVLHAVLEIVNELKKSTGPLNEVSKMVKEFQKTSQDQPEVSKHPTKILQKVLEEVKKSAETNKNLKAALQDLETAEENQEEVLADVLVNVLEDENLQEILKLLKQVEECMDDNYLAYYGYDRPSEWEEVGIELRCYYGFIGHVDCMRSRLISDEDLESFEEKIDKANEFADAVSSGNDIKGYTVKPADWGNLLTFLTKIQERLQKSQKESLQKLQQDLFNELNKPVGKVLKCVLKKLATAKKLGLLDGKIDLTINPDRGSYSGDGIVNLQEMDVINLCHELAHRAHAAFLGDFVTPTLIVKGQDEVPVKVPNIGKVGASDFENNHTWEGADDLLTITGRSYAFCLPKTGADPKTGAKPELRGVLIIDNECENMARHLANRRYRINHNSGEVANEDEKMHAFYEQYAGAYEERTE